MGPPFSVLPSFRPDKALNIHKAGFVEYIHKLLNEEVETLRAAYRMAKANVEMAKDNHADNLDTLRKIENDIDIKLDDALHALGDFEEEDF